ncbi:MAG: PhzF family phenazine biosynthesis protein [Bacteroidetes bacterium]|nr:MAG: PhzF family phenazine biosynthesis protein [Bacteroidota bacterium]
MPIPLYQVDAFTRQVFHGNPAAVCPLDEWLPDDRLQVIAAENNLAETAFLVPEGAGYRLRWFTPVLEIDLCGHATLAAAHVLYTELGYDAQRIRFFTRSGELPVVRDGDRYRMDFPARPPEPCPAPPLLIQALGRQPLWTGRSRDYLALLEDETTVRDLQPDLAAVARLEAIGLIVTAPGNKVDFVSRFFAPQAGVPEDPVTGSAHSTLVPFWAERLQKNSLHARQISARGGELWTEALGERVFLSGEAVTVIRGTLFI